MKKRKINFALAIASTMVAPAIAVPIATTQQYVVSNKQVNKVESNTNEASNNIDVSTENSEIVESNVSDKISIEDKASTTDKWWLSEKDKESLNKVESIFSSSNMNDVVTKLSSLINSNDSKSAANIVNTFFSTKEKVNNESLTSNKNIISENDILGFELKQMDNNGINFSVKLSENGKNSNLYLDENTSIMISGSDLDFKLDTKQKGIYFYSDNLLSPSMDEILTSNIDLSKYSAIAALSKNESTKTYDLFVAPVILDDVTNQYTYLGSRVSLWLNNQASYSVVNPHWSFRINLNLSYDNNENAGSTDNVEKPSLNVEEKELLAKYDGLFSNNSTDYIAKTINSSISEWSANQRKQLALSIIRSKFQLFEDFNETDETNISKDVMLKESQVYGVDSVWSDENSNLWFNIKLNNSIGNYKTFLYNKNYKAGYQILASDFKVCINTNNKQFKFINDTIFESTQDVQKTIVADASNYAGLIGIVKENGNYKLHFSTNYTNQENKSCTFNSQISYYLYKFENSKPTSFSWVNFSMPMDMIFNTVSQTSIASTLSYNLPKYGTFCSNEMALDYIFQTGCYDFGPTQTKRIINFIQTTYKNIKVKSLVSKTLISKNQAKGVYEIMPADGYKWEDGTKEAKTITVYVQNFNIY